MQLTVLVASPRVAPGLMTSSAWASCARADRVLASSAMAPMAVAVAAAGHAVEEVAPAREVLVAAARAGRAVWLADGAEAAAVPALLAGSGVDVDVLQASYDVPGARLLDLVEVMDRLRTECPWDREQTHRSLAPYLLEETYETLEAIETGDPVHLREELGDLLLQVMFHARVASEKPDGFTLDDVADGIVAKLVYRHPHVFGGLDVADADEVERNWDTLKAAEKQRSAPLEGVPIALPALALADKVLGRLRRSGVAIGAPEPGIGADLLAVVVRARAQGVDAEQALRDTVRAVTDGQW